MGALYNGLDWIDSWLLAMTLRGLTLCVEWLSWTRRGMERGMMAGYVATLGMGCYAVWARVYSSWAAAAMVAVWSTVIAGGMWVEHSRTDQMRLYKMVMSHWVHSRLGMIVINLGLSILFVFSPPHRLTDIGYVVAQALYVLFHYSTSLPEHGEPGRKRKLALAELKRLFGSSWIPQPQRSAEWITDALG